MERHTLTCFDIAVHTAIRVLGDQAVAPTGEALQAASQPVSASTACATYHARVGGKLAICGTKMCGRFGVTGAEFVAVFLLARKSKQGALAQRIVAACRRSGQGQAADGPTARLDRRAACVWVRRGASAWRLGPDECPGPGHAAQGDSVMT